MNVKLSFDSIHVVVELSPLYDRLSQVVHVTEDPGIFLL